MSFRSNSITIGHKENPDLHIHSLHQHEKLFPIRAASTLAGRSWGTAHLCNFRIALTPSTVTRSNGRHPAIPHRSIQFVYQILPTYSPTTKCTLISAAPTSTNNATLRTLFLHRHTPRHRIHPTHLARHTPLHLTTALRLPRQNLLPHNQRAPVPTQRQPRRQSPRRDLIRQKPADQRSL
jgi:hypothetical protein